MPIKTVLSSGCFSAFAKCKHALASSRKSNPSAIAPSPCPPLRSERLGQQSVIENRPAAAGNLAVELVMRAPPDGYALLLVGEYNAVNATLYDKLDFVFVRDIAPVAGIMRTPNVIVVNPSVPAMTLPEFISYAKANPGKVNMASAGNGTSPHITGEQFKMMAGIDMLHVPCRGGALALIDLLSGQVQV
jgi:tripartite-type tricarboxylate transporter receptor subunit TctC